MTKRRGSTGTSTSTITYSLGKLAAIEHHQRKQEDRWASKASDVETGKLTPEEITARRKNRRATSPFRKKSLHARGFPVFQNF